MSASLNDVDMNGIEGQMGGSGVLPAGVYRCVLVEGNRKPTKSNTGELLELKFSVQNGEFAGSKITHRLNLWNPNATASRIAKQEYKKLLDTINLAPQQVSDVSQMFNIPLDVELSVRPYTKNDGTQSESNEVTDFIPVGVVNNQQPPQQGQPQYQNQNTQNQGQAQRPY